jgi:hypothetical protein
MVDQLFVIFFLPIQYPMSAESASTLPPSPTSLAIPLITLPHEAFHTIFPPESLAISMASGGVGVFASVPASPPVPFPTSLAIPLITPYLKAFHTISLLRKASRYQRHREGWGVFASVSATPQPLFQHPLTFPLNKHQNRCNKINNHDVRGTDQENDLRCHLPRYNKCHFLMERNNPLHEK